jgi:hypothetical protein
MLFLIGFFVVAVAVWWGTIQIARELRAAKEEASRTRALDLLGLLSPAIGAAQSNPKSVLAWQPVANIARQLFPAELALLDRAAGGVFPLSKAQLEAAHAQWTTDWLAWEQSHDAEYKLKATVVEQELMHVESASGGSSIIRARLEAVEREKLEKYQRRYSEYVRVAKALQALIS